MEEACCCDCDGYKVKINGAETWYEALTEHNFGFVSQPNRLSDQHMRATLIHSKNIISNRSKILLLYTLKIKKYAVFGLLRNAFQYSR